MQHVLFGQKTVFLGDEAATLLVDFAAHVAQLGTGARIDMRGISAEGHIVHTTFLLNSGTTLSSESTSIEMEEPDNSEAIAYIRGRIDEFSANPDFFDGFHLEDEPA